MSFRGDWVSTQKINPLGYQTDKPCQAEMPWTGNSWRSEELGEKHHMCLAHSYCPLKICLWPLLKKRTLDKPKVSGRSLGRSVRGAFTLGGFSLPASSNKQLRWFFWPGVAVWHVVLEWWQVCRDVALWSKCNQCKCRLRLKGQKEPSYKQQFDVCDSQGELVFVSAFLGSSGTWKDLITSHFETTNINDVFTYTKEVNFKYVWLVLMSSVFLLHLCHY